MLLFHYLLSSSVLCMSKKSFVHTNIVVALRIGGKIHMFAMAQIQRIGLGLHTCFKGMGMVTGRKNSKYAIIIFLTTICLTLLEISGTIK